MFVRVQSKKNASTSNELSTHSTAGNLFFFCNLIIRKAEKYVNWENKDYLELDFVLCKLIFSTKLTNTRKTREYCMFLNFGKSLSHIEVYLNYIEDKLMMTFYFQKD